MNARRNQHEDLPVDQADQVLSRRQPVKTARRSGWTITNPYSSRRRGDRINGRFAAPHESEVAPNGHADPIDDVRVGPKAEKHTSARRTLAKRSTR